MFEGTYQIADTVVQICSQYPQIHQMAAGYQTSTMEPVETSIHILMEDIEQERALSDLQAQKESGRDGGCLYSSGYLETLAVYRKLADFLSRKETVLFHGSAVVAEGQVYLFTAPSGTGKTTHTRFWLEKIPGSFVLNGDKPLLKITDHGVTVYGTPWQGKEGMGCNRALPLAAICVLERSDQDQIEEISWEEAFPILARQTYRVRDSRQYLNVLTALGKLKKQVRFYRMHCSLDPDSAWVSWKGMQP